MMRALVGLLVAGSMLGSPVHGDEAVSAVKEAISRLNAAFEKGDPEAVGRLLTQDHLAVTTYYGPPQGRSKQLETLKDLQLSEYSAGEMQLRVLGKGVVLVHYPLKLKGTYQGKPVPERNSAVAIWVEREGKWLEAYYQETPLNEK